MALIRTIPLLFGLALAGCGSTFSAPATQEADRQAQAAYADCAAQLRSGALRSYRQAAACAQPKVVAAYRQNAYPYMDLVQLELVARATGAEAIDTGAAKPDDVDRDIAQLEHRIAAERQRRLSGEMGNSVPYVPPEQLLDGLATLTNQPLPRSGANCFAIGSFNRCN